MANPQGSTHDDFADHARAAGVPVPLHPEVRAAYARIGETPPAVRQNLVVATPPDASTGLCGHCGRPAEGGLRMLHAVAGFEHTPLRIVILHCQDCRFSAHCDPAQTSPGSGMPEGVPAGFCEPIVNVVTTSCEVVPGLRFAGKVAKWALALGMLGVTALGLVHSQGQMNAGLEGGTQVIAVQDSTAGHGYNSGSLKLYTGSAPVSGNAAETGTVLVTVALPNGIFNGQVAGFPAVATAITISSATISATGTAGYGRMLQQGDTGASSTTECRLQFTVGTSGADCILNTLSLVNGGTLTVTSLTYTVAA